MVFGLMMAIDYNNDTYHPQSLSRFALESKLDNFENRHFVVHQLLEILHIRKVQTVLLPLHWFLLTLM